MQDSGILPTKENLKRLPLRAIVAFAARCARRVQPLYAQDETATGEGAAVLERAIRFAEGVARGGTATGENGTAAYEVGCEMSGSATTAAFAAMCAAHCADQASSAHIFPDAAEKVPEYGAEAAINGGAMVTPYVTKTLQVVNQNPTLADLAALLGMGLGEFPDRGQPVDPSESGPLGALWQHGVPEWYR